jgi:hypothetical protein
VSPPAPEDKLRCRLIATADLEAVTALLTEGFGARANDSWRCGLERLRDREVAEGLPRYGYCLDVGGRLVGAILLIAGHRRREGAVIPVTNVASWYVQPDYRAYAQLLVSMALKNRQTTYLNISAAPHTWPIVAKQGYDKYCSGLFVCLAALKAPAAGVTVFEVGAEGEAAAVLGDLPDLALLRRHAAWGCTALVLQEGESLHPMIFRRYTIRRGRLRLPAVHVLHAPDRDALVRLAGNIGRHFLRNGALFLLLDANGPVAGLTGFYTERRGRKFSRGPNPPALSDLADTEYAIFGF